MSNSVFTNYLRGCESISQSVGDFVRNPWLWMFAPYLCAIKMMDILLVGDKSPETPVELEKGLRQETPGEVAEAAVEPEKRLRQETLREFAMKRMKSGYAPPREIYDVRNHKQINWSDVPEWARPVDPELFEVGHEG